jgi:NAD(P)H dehydrogenase (quinone)
MGRILVLYDSATGNTEKMAYLVAEGAGLVDGTEVRIRSVAEAVADDVLWCDGIAVGSPTNCGVLSWKMKKFWDDLVDEYWGRIDGKMGCAFSSSGGWAGGNEVTCLSILTVLMNFGFLVFGVTDYVANQFTLHYGAALAGEPRAEREQEACRRLGRRLAQWVRVYVDGERDLVQETGARQHM